MPKEPKAAHTRELLHIATQVRVPKEVDSQLVTGSQLVALSGTSTEHEVGASFSARLTNPTETGKKNTVTAPVPGGALHVHCCVTS